LRATLDLLETPLKLLRGPRCHGIRAPAASGGVLRNFQARV
jgi:hypothetical protein